MSFSGRLLSVAIICLSVNILHLYFLQTTELIQTNLALITHRSREFKFLKMFDWLDSVLHPVGNISATQRRFYKWRNTGFFSWRDNNDILKLHCPHLIIVLFRSNKQISTKFGRKYSWVQETQFCLNDGPRPFPGGDNNEKWKCIDNI